MRPRLPIYLRQLVNLCFIMPLSNSGSKSQKTKPPVHPKTPTTLPNHSNPPPSQLTRATQRPVLPHPPLHRRLLVLLREQGAPVERLVARRHVERGVPGEEVDGLERHADDLAGHDGEVLGARHVLEPELEPEDDVGVDDGLAAVRPRAHPGAAARLVRVPAAGVELAVAVPGDVDVVVGELGALVVEGARVRHHLLEGRGVDLVADGLAVDGVPGGLVEDLEGAGRGGVGVQAGRLGDRGFRDGVADAVGVEVGDGHRVDFVVNEAVGVAVYCRINAEREDVLMVDGEDARVDDGSPWYLDAFVNGLSADDAGRSDLVGQLARLIEHESHDVLIVGDCDDGLDDEFPTSNNSCSAGSVVGVLPANASVLLVDADYVVHGHWLSVSGC